MIEKICQNKIYQECMDKIVKISEIDMVKYIETISKEAIEIAKRLKINTDIIEKAVALTYLGLAIEQEDYIKSSGILAVKILSEIGEDEDTIARVLMAIAGQGNNGNSINLFSAVILLANLKHTKDYIKISKIKEEQLEEMRRSCITVLGLKGEEGEKE